MPLKKVQKRFTKRIYFLSHLSHPERLAVINLELFELCRLKNDLDMYFKCSHNLVALPTDVYLCQQNYDFHTRSNDIRRIIPLCSTNHLTNDCLIVV